jgi:PLP dependent protein
MLRDRIQEVEARIQAAARRSGRSRQDIALVAVTKTLPAAAITEAYALGIRDFGENYVQEFSAKAPEGALPGARFHLIGHLQANKSQRAAELFDVIQTVDSERLGRRLNDAPHRRSEPLEILIEVRLSEEPAKSGATPEEVPALAAALGAFPNLRLTGLLTVPPWSDDPEASRPYFRRLRELATRLGLPQLSMGMSHDLEVAVEEGATIVRVGTALFGSRTP